MDENFIIEYSKFLDASKEHLTYETIALYINFSRNFSRKEVKFFEDHLNSCSACFEKFKELFDEDIDLDDNRKKIELKEKNITASENAYKKYVSDDNSVEFLFRREKNGLIYLLFNKTANDLLFSNLRITGENNEVLVRIVSVESGKRYKISNNILNISSLKDLNLDYLNSIKKEELIKEKKNKLIYWYAAASVIIIFLILYLLIPSEEPVQITEKKIPAKTDTVAKVIIPDTSAMKMQEVNILVPPEFASNNVLENFINRNVRSGNSVEIISPPIGDTIKTHLHFEWSRIEDANEYIIEIVDNKNRFVWEKNVDYNQVTFLDQLEPGLYYWKIKYKGRMTAVGKFFVK